MDKCTNVQQILFYIYANIWAKNILQSRLISKNINIIISNYIYDNYTFNISNFNAYNIINNNVKSILVKTLYNDIQHKFKSLSRLQFYERFYENISCLVKSFPNLIHLHIGCLFN
jgi:hypothetical protein